MPRSVNVSVAPLAFPNSNLEAHTFCQTMNFIRFITGGLHASLSIPLELYLSTHTTPPPCLVKILVYSISSTKSLIQNLLGVSPCNFLSFFDFRMYSSTGLSPLINSAFQHAIQFQGYDSLIIKVFSRLRAITTGSLWRTL